MYFQVCFQKVSWDHQIRGSKWLTTSLGKTILNFQIQLVLLQKSFKENVKSIFGDVLNANKVLKSTSFSQSVTSFSFLYSIPSKV